MSVLHLSLPVRRLTDFSAWRLLGFNRTCEPTDQRNCLFTGREIPVCHQLGREEEGDYALRAGRRWHGLERECLLRYDRRARRRCTRRDKGSKRQLVRLRAGVAYGPGAANVEPFLGEFLTYNAPLEKALWKNPDPLSLKNKSAA